MIDEATSLLSAAILLLGCGMWPVAFLFAGCAPCCDDQCPEFINFNRCLRVIHVGTDPLVGGDCRITSLRNQLGQQISPVRIYSVSSKTEITVRVRLQNAIPTGETRAEVWRFNVSQPANLAPFDVVGPPWHLQVDLSYTGVATQQEAGVQSSIQEDEHGQPKLVVTINHFGSFFERTENITIFPTGLQRWSTSEITQNQVNATRVSAGLSVGLVTKMPGRSVQERQIAAELAGGLCALGGGGLLTQKVLLNAASATNFLSGAESLEVNATEPTRTLQLQVTPDSELCEIPATAFGTGIALGIYPEFLTAVAPEDVSSRITSPGEGRWCGPNVMTLRPSGLVFRILEDCPSRWSGRYDRKGVTVDHTAFLSDFFNGLTLLRNLEDGPYRESFVTADSDFFSMEGWTISLGGEGQFNLYETTDIFRCPPSTGNNYFVDDETNPGTTLGDICTPLLTPATPFAPATSFICLVDWTVEYKIVTGAECDAAGEFQLKATTITRSSDDGGPIEVAMVRQGGNEIRTNGEGLPIITFRGSGSIDFPPIPPLLLDDQPCGGQLKRPLPSNSVEIIWSAIVPCEDAGDLVLDDTLARVITPFFDLEQELLTAWARPGFPDVVVFGTNIIDRAVWSFSFRSPESVPYVPSIRTLCSDWSAAVIPPEGGTVTRECTNQFGGPFPEGYPIPILSKTFPASAVRHPRILSSNEGSGNTILIRQGKCLLRGLSTRGEPTSIQPSTISFASVPQGCYNYGLSFGPPVVAEDSNTCGLSVLPTHTPCNGCVPSVELISGEEVGQVRYAATGDKEGTLEWIALRDWRGGEGITFTVTCGNDTITQRIQRQTTAPEAPINLTATRGPCSEASLAWQVPFDGGSPITGYRVERRVFNTGSYQLITTAPGNATAATLSGLLRLGYQFRVAAINALGTGPYSNIVAVDGFTLGAPTSLTFTRNPCDTVSLSWTPPTQSECVVVASYRLEYRNASGGAYTLGATVAGTATSGSISGLPTNVRLQFRVGRVDDANTTLYSGTVISGNLPLTPSAPTATLGEDAGNVNLTWTAQETQCFENTDYNVQFSSSTTQTFSDFARSPSTAKSATVTGLTPGVTYFFRVRAVNAVGTGSFSPSSGLITIPE
jgi:hypothetical protein